uniref:Phage tail fibre protein N-terminal domain-containing protein n=1 Tax=Aliivibrio wodanis TaxID=80852 RepID=A0A5Q4ZRY4_9GAMM|nr:hypothetical protein AW0309160_01827 [Aliivibrio wodanis]
MSQTIITKAFETYKAEKEAVLQSVQLDEFVLANVPGLDPTQPIDRNETVPTEHIVHVSDVHQDGFVNPNAVVYSITLDTRLGDFDFNWIGLRNKASGVLAAITHLAPISKYKSIPGVQNGNAITRSMLMSYLGAKLATGISVDASTWQIDFTARLFGIDEAERLANRDHYDGATFFSSGFLVYKEGASYKVTAGLGYVEGLRTLLNGDHILTVPSGQHYVYVDSSWQGQVTSRWHSVVTFQVSTTELTHYTDEHGFIHYLAKIATIQSNGNVIDHRIVKAEFERKDNAATNADIDNKSTAAKHIKLPQFWRAFLGFLTNDWNGSRTDVGVSQKGVTDGLATKTDKSTFENHDHDDDYYLKHQTDSLLTGKIDKTSITDSTGSTSSVLVASAKAIKTVKDIANAKWTYVTATTGRYGATLLSNLYNGSSQTKAVTELALKNGLATKTDPNHNHDTAYWKRGEKVNDSAQLNGHGLTDAATANTVAKRNASGDLLARLFRSNYANSSSISGALAFRVNNSSDSYIRFCSNISAIKNWLVAASKPDYRYTAANITLTRKAERTVIQRWGTQNATILIDVSTFQVGDIITIVNVRNDSGMATITNLDGTIYVFNGSNAGTHTFTGMGQISFIKHSSGNTLMEMTE